MAIYSSSVHSVLFDIVTVTVAVQCRVLGVGTGNISSNFSFRADICIARFRQFLSHVSYDGVGCFENLLDELQLVEILSTKVLLHDGLIFGVLMYVCRPLGVDTLSYRTDKR